MFLFPIHSPTGRKYEICKLEKLYKQQDRLRMYYKHNSIDTKII